MKKVMLIEPSDIKIGNWFLNEDDKFFVKCTEKNISDLIKDCNSLRPIPLDKDIMGANDDAFDFSRFKVSWGWEDKLYETTGMFYYSVAVDTDKVVGTGTFCYVNEVQDFLRVAGLEKLANEFKIQKGQF